MRKEQYEDEKEAAKEQAAANKVVDSDGNEDKAGNGTANLEADPLLILVNKENALPEDYDITLKTLPDGVNKASEVAYQPLVDMLNAGRKEGLAFEICSSYRSVDRQKELFYEDSRFKRQSPQERQYHGSC